MRIAQILKLGVVVIVLMLAIACSPSPMTTTSTSPAMGTPSSSPSEPATTSTAPSEAWVQQIQTTLAEKLGLPPDQIQLQEATSMEWGDACLGLPQPDELCAQIITPGYQARLTTSQGEYVIHSDRTGRAVRIAEPVP